MTNMEKINENFSTPLLNDLEICFTSSLVMDRSTNLLIFKLFSFIYLIVLPKNFDKCEPVTKNSNLKYLSFLISKIRFFSRSNSDLDPVITQIFII